jgi:hypothetical protein
MAEDAELVRLGEAHRAVEQQRLAEIELGGRDIEVRAVRIGGAERSDQRVFRIVLVLDADRDLRDPAILLEDGVAEETELCAVGRYVDLEVRAEAERDADILQVELLLRDREFDAVVDGDQRAEGFERKIICLDAREIGRAADLVARAVAADERPRREAAAGRPFDLADAAGEQELARHVVHACRLRRSRCGHCDAHHRRQGAGHRRRGCGVCCCFRFHAWSPSPPPNLFTQGYREVLRRSGDAGSEAGSKIVNVPAPAKAYGIRGFHRFG